jgi:hypothetical protein
MKYYDENTGFLAIDLIELGSTSGGQAWGCYHQIETFSDMKIGEE